MESCLFFWECVDWQDGRDGDLSVCLGVSVLSEMEHKLFVFQEVDEDIHRSIQVGQEAGEGAGTF